jgi:hypothetical protein
LEAEYGEFGDSGQSSVHEPACSVLQCGVEQCLRAEHVRGDERGDAGDRAIDVRLGGEVHDEVMAGDDLIDDKCIADVAVDKPQAWVVAHRCEVVHVSRIRQVVQYRHRDGFDRRVARAGALGRPQQHAYVL